MRAVSQQSQRTTPFPTKSTPRLGRQNRVSRYARGETRTRKTRRSGDFESPASTNSTTRAVHGNVLLGVYFLNADGSVRYRSVRWWHGQGAVTLGAVLTQHLLDAPADLLLQRRVPRAL